MLIDLSIFKLNILWNSPYSPKFNPIEELFGVIKSKLKMRIMQTENHLKDEIVI